MPNDRRRSVEPYSIWRLLCYSDTELGLLIACMMLEPLRTDVCCVITGVTMITAKGFTKGTSCYQNLPPHRHISSNRVAYRNARFWHTSISTPYYPVEFIGEPEWAGLKPARLDLPADT